MAEDKKEQKHGENKEAEKVQQTNEKPEVKKEDLRLIVRVANMDLDGTLNIPRALLKIKGINNRTARNIAVIFEKTAGINADEKLGKITEEQTKKLETIVLEPVKSGIPIWSLNRRKDFTTGEDKHLVTGELDFSLRTDLLKLGEIKSYRGLRHAWALPVRGQRTKSTHRGKGKVIGVIRKDTKSKT